MRTFFLFYVLSRLFGNPFIALLIVGVVLYLADARFNGRWFVPGQMFRKRHVIRELERTLERNPHDAGAHNDLGRLLAQQRRYDKALPHMERAIRRMEETPETNYYYGLCLLETGNEDEGLRRIRRALEINPRFSYGEPQVLLARVHLDAGENEEARGCARVAVKINTSSVEGWVLLARAEERLGNGAAAREAYAEAKNAYKHLPSYLHLPNRRWLVAAKRGARALRA